jgi:HSP20 family molecular chaperone IbpA
VAGLNQDDIEIVCEHNMLTVRGKSKETGAKTFSIAAFRAPPSSVSSTLPSMSK